jgi:hypothetical protein
MLQEGIFTEQKRAFQLRTEEMKTEQVDTTFRGCPLRRGKSVGMHT